MTHDTYLLFTPVLMLGVMMLARFVGCQRVLGLEPVAPPPPPPVNFVSTETLGTARNDFSGWVGMSITVDSTALTVVALGRMILPGNTGAHDVRIVDAASMTPIQDSTVAIDTSGKTAGQFEYTSYTHPITLSAGQTYYIMSHEMTNGDDFYDDDTSVQTMGGASINMPVYSDDATPNMYMFHGTAGHSYGPVDFQYNMPT